MTVYVLIPAHNEAGTIASVVRGAMELGARVLVVDDHCTDATAARAQHAGAEVWRHEGTPGKASALRAAWSRLAPDPAWTHLLLMDADGQHDPADGHRLIAQAHSADLVVGSRSPFQHPMPPVRRFINRLMSAIIARCSGLALDDSQCGFRMVSRRLIEDGNWTSVRFELESEMILQAARLRLIVKQVPVACHYGGRRSHIQPCLDTLRWLWWLGRSAGSP